MKRSRGKSLNQEMNLTNMIDVVFAILIVFLISAPLMSQGIKADLPDVKAHSLPQEKMCTVSIDKSEKIYIEGMEVRLNNFDKIFESLCKDEKPVVIQSDESASYGTVMKIVSLVQLAGVKQLGFLTYDKSVTPNRMGKKKK